MFNLEFFLDISNCGRIKIPLQRHPVDSVGSVRWTGVWWHSGPTPGYQWQHQYDGLAENTYIGMIMCEQNVNCRHDFTMFMNKNERMNEYRCTAKLTPQYADVGITQVIKVLILLHCSYTYNTMNFSFLN